ncbi:basic proline-rich protein-like [Piliocolobus tephrosceles]|uniref:basic proline-rich protein-like n=1 Tax=Piliocolobus tephrosceles TaxID=591936 RepID=UPI000E6B3E67|nr:basic proline-rich protein-like [Piliocolobus tephrosceles]
MGDGENHIEVFLKFQSLMGNPDYSSSTAAIFLLKILKINSGINVITSQSNKHSLLFFIKHSVLSPSQPVKAQSQVYSATVTYPDNLTSPGSSSPQACSLPSPRRPLSRPPPAVATPHPGKHAPPSRERFLRVLGAAGPAPRRPEPGAQSRPGDRRGSLGSLSPQRAPHLAPLPPGRRRAPARPSERTETGQSGAAAPQPQTNDSPLPARRPSASRGGSAPAPAPPRLGTAPSSPGRPAPHQTQPRLHSLRDAEGHSPRRLLPPLLLPLGPLPSPPPPPPPAPPSALAPAPPAILLPPPPPPSPLLSVAQAPGLLQVPFSAILTPRGSGRSSAPRGPGAPARRCGAGRSPRPPLPSARSGSRDPTSPRASGRVGGGAFAGAMGAECARIILGRRVGAGCRVGGSLQLVATSCLFQRIATHY